MFVTVPVVRQTAPITLDMLLSDFVTIDMFKPNRSTTDTRTYNPDNIPEKIKDSFNPGMTKEVLNNFCNKYADIIAADKTTLYTHYEIPKKGSYETRPIDAPNDNLRQAFNDLKYILENNFNAIYHTCAMAYIPHRSTVTCVQRHQANQSRWFLKTDIHGFFPNTTPEFLYSMLYQTFPIGYFVKFPGCKELFEKAMSVCFLRGGLPQGSPVSPMLTNMMMIPMDYTINKWCHEHTPYIVYTRYADDMYFSSKFTFNWQEVVDLVKNTLTNNGASFELNTKKTHYGSNAGRNWLLGIMLNQQGSLTVGYRNHEKLRAVLNNFAVDQTNNRVWTVYDAQVLLGRLNYFKQIEPGTGANPSFVDKTLTKVNDKYNIDCLKSLKKIISGV